MGYERYKFMNFDNRKQVFEEESYLDFENGYPERTIEWFEQHIYPHMSPYCNKDVIRLLDVGCASGYFTRRFEQLCNEVYGVDLASNRIKHAKQYETDKLKFYNIDITKDPLMNVLPKRPNLIFSNAVIPHIPLKDKAAAFENIAACSTLDATFVLFDDLVPSGCVDDFVGLYSREWIDQNTPWSVVKVVDITPGTYKIVLNKKC